MSYPSICLLGLILLSGLCVCPQVWADNIIYATNFSDANDWVTNSPMSFYLDNETGRYHYAIEGGTGSSAYYQLPTSYTGPFSLEFDVYPIKTDEMSSFRFGLGKESMDSQKGPVILAELNNQDGDRAFSLVAISKENLLSKTFSIPGKENYSGNTVRFSDDTEYHIKIVWYPVDKRVSMTVTTPSKDEPVFSHFVMVSGKFEEFTHLFMTSVGEGQNGAKAEGYIDNIVLTALNTIPSTTEPTITETEQTPVATLVPDTPVIPIEDTPEDIPERTPLPTPPTPTPTQKSELTPIIGIVGLLIIGLYMRKV